MIIPLVIESTWRSLLKDLPVWELPQTHTLVIAPHPDDETLGAGGLIARLRAQGTRVTIVAVTDGELAYGESPGMAEVRTREQTEALRALGVVASEIIRLHLPDTRLGENEDRIAEALLPLLERDTHLLAPWQKDYHPDHEACGRAAARVAREAGIACTFYLFWTWHRGTPADLDAASLTSLPLAENEVGLKKAALLCHQSQLKHPSGEPILPAYLLEPLSRPFEVFIRS